MKAIETEYNGVLFRSRLEARWALFFDTLGVRWQYEREGYELPSGRYVPDFWLPDVGPNSRGSWFEVKGQIPAEREQRLCSELASQSHHDVWLQVGGTEPTGLWYPTEKTRSDHKEFWAYFEWDYMKRNVTVISFKQASAACRMAWRVAEKHRFWNPKGRR